MPDDRIALGISSCLLGQPVRYDGGHKRDHYLKDTLGRFVRWVPVYDAKGVPSRRGIGLFAREFMARFPLIPVEDDGRLHDPGISENFIERVFVYSRWLQLMGTDVTARGLVDFHTEHKLLVMAHSIPALRELGRLVAGMKRPSQALFEEYVATLMRALRLEATVKKNVNVLQHAMGYFKKHLTADEKAELLEVIGSYHRGEAPLVVPIVLLNHYVRKYGEPYLARQHHLSPHPAELALRAWM